MSTELKDAFNYCAMWDKVRKLLNSSDVTATRVTQHWSALFGLKCEDRDSFLQFYSSAKSILHNLKTNKSVTMTYELGYNSVPYYIMILQFKLFVHNLWISTVVYLSV